MQFIIENGVLIVAAVAVAGGASLAIWRFAKMPSSEQLKKVKEWLLYAVTTAEKELGAGTGKIKLRYVYDLFVSRFGWLAKIITFEAFSQLVDEALEEMRDMLDTNIAAKAFVDGGEDNA